MKEETIIQILNSLTTVGEKSLDDLELEVIINY